MEAVGTEVRCPSCGALASSRFCGHCGARVRARAPAARTEAPGRGVPLHDPRDDGPDHGGRETPAAPRSRARGAAVLAVVLIAAAVAGVLVRPSPEVVTADGLAGPDGSGRTSTRAVTELTSRWDAAWDGAPVPRSGIRALHDLGDVLVLATDGELIGLTHPTALPDARGRGLQRPVDPVLWRSPAIDGTPRPVDGLLPVLAGAELLWLSSATGGIADRHDVDGLEHPVSWSPAFATPTGDLLVTPDGTAVLGQGGAVRWQQGDPGELVGVAGDVVVTLVDRTVVGRDVGTGEERWSVELQPSGHVSARLVDGVLVTAELGGRVTTREPTSGSAVATARIGPVPATGPSWDGEATIVGATDTDVFVRVDAPVGIRYARVRAATADVLANLVELANDDLRAVTEHAGYLVTVGWDAVEVRRGGEVVWTAVDLEQPPAGDGAWLALSDGPFGVVGVDGSPTRIRVEAAGQQAPAWRPAVLDGHAVVGSATGVQALDLATGERVWSRPLGTWGCCPPLLVGGSAIALNGPVRVLDPDGTRRWDDPVAGADQSARVAAVAAPWVVVTRRAGGSAGATELLRLPDGRAGPELAGAGIDGVVVGGTRAFGLEHDPSGATHVVAFDLPPEGTRGRTVQPSWRRPAGAGIQLVHAEDELLVVGPAAVDHLDPGTGELLRRTRFGSLGAGPVAFADGRLVRRADAVTLETVDLASGGTWTRQFPEPLTAAPTIAGDLVYVAAGAVVSALALETGRTVASTRIEGTRVSALTVAGGVVLAGGPDRLHALGPPATAGGASAGG